MSTQRDEINRRKRIASPGERTPMGAGMAVEMRKRKRQVSPLTEIERRKNQNKAPRA